MNYGESLESQPLPGDEETPSSSGDDSSSIHRFQGRRVQMIRPLFKKVSYSFPTSGEL